MVPGTNSRRRTPRRRRPATPRSWSAPRHHAASVSRYARSVSVRVRDVLQHHHAQGFDGLRRPVRLVLLTALLPAQRHDAPHAASTSAARDGLARRARISGLPSRARRSVSDGDPACHGQASGYPAGDEGRAGGRPARQGAWYCCWRGLQGTSSTYGATARLSHDIADCGELHEFAVEWPTGQCSLSSSTAVSIDPATSSTRMCPCRPPLRCPIAQLARVWVASTAKFL